MERIKRVPQKPAAWLAQGIAFHEAVEKWELSLRRMDDGGLATAYLEAYEREITEGLAVEPDRDKWMTGGRTKGSDDIDRRRTRGLEQVGAYVGYMETAAEHPLMLDDETPLVEWPFSIDLDGIQVVGYVDIVNEWPNGAVGPRDLKTGSKLPDFPELQLGVYKVALEDTFPVEISYGDLFMLKDGKPRQALNIERFTRDYVTELFHTLDTSISQGLFLPNPSDFCRVCSVADYCKATGGQFA